MNAQSTDGSTPLHQAAVVSVELLLYFYFFIFAFLLFGMLGPVHTHLFSKRFSSKLERFHQFLLSTHQRLKLFETAFFEVI